jgi:hypothetical protein
LAETERINDEHVLGHFYHRVTYGMDIMCEHDSDEWTLSWIKWLKKK